MSMWIAGAMLVGGCVLFLGAGLTSVRAWHRAETDLATEQVLNETLAADNAGLRERMLAQRKLLVASRLYLERLKAEHREAPAVEPWP